MDIYLPFPELLFLRYLAHGLKKFWITNCKVNKEGTWVSSLMNLDKNSSFKKTKRKISWMKVRRRAEKNFTLFLLINHERKVGFFLCHHLNQIYSVYHVLSTQKNNG